MGVRMAHGVEADRLEQARAGVPWKRWGPYLSERQWGTVREDYSDNGDAWNYFSHDQARSRAYKWGEDGIAGFCDDHQRLCFGIALWNGVDPILKERMFGLTNSEGNHGEDVKEYYFYLDATPTSSYLKYRYRYPLNEFPYADLVATNRARSRLELEYELLDTGVFDDDRYVDVDVEYAKSAPDDVHVRITLINRSQTGRRCTCCRRCGSATTGGWTSRRARSTPRTARPAQSSPPSTPTWASSSCAARANRRCCSPRTRRTRSACGASANSSPYVKDAFHEYVVHGQDSAVNPARTGTKAAAHYVLDIAAGRRSRRATPVVSGRTPRRSAAARSTACSRRASPTPTSSTRRSRRRRRRPTRRWSCARRWPGCCGGSSCTASISIVGSTSTTCTRFGIRTHPTSATGTGST